MPSNNKIFRKVVAKQKEKACVAPHLDCVARPLLEEQQSVVPADRDTSSCSGLPPVEGGEV